MVIKVYKSTIDDSLVKVLTITNGDRAVHFGDGFCQVYNSIDFFELTETRGLKEITVVVV